MLRTTYLVLHTTYYLLLTTHYLLLRAASSNASLIASSKTKRSSPRPKPQALSTRAWGRFEHDGLAADGLPADGLPATHVLVRVGHRFVFLVPNGDDMGQLLAWAEEGKIKPVVDSVYPMAQAVEAAQRNFSGRAKGKVVVSVAERSV